jgi:hypothetical protein
MRQGRTCASVCGKVRGNVCGAYIIYIYTHTHACEGRYVGVDTLQQGGTRLYIQMWRWIHCSNALQQGGYMWRWMPSAARRNSHIYTCGGGYTATRRIQCSKEELADMYTYIYIYTYIYMREGMWRWIRRSYIYCVCVSVCVCVCTYIQICICKQM